MNFSRAGVTLLRVVLGILFLAHGISKLEMGLGNVAGWFGSIGLPAFLAYGVTALELAGGAALILGIATRLFSLLFIGMLAGAVFKVKLAAGLLGSSQSPGYELDLALMVIAAYLVVAQDTGYAIQNLWSSKKASSPAVLKGEGRA